MKRTLLFALIAGTALPAAASDQADVIQRGAYQSVIGDCKACHTKPGGLPYAGGNPIETPFGTLVPPNITPDSETGIGDWSAAEFRAAIKHGIGKGGKRLYPAMPYPNYTLMPDSDVEDLYAYFRTIEPVKNAVKANLLPFPFNIRLAMAGWNFLNFQPRDFVPDNNRSAEWNRGRYLVEGPGHCGSCHTPKSLTGADKSNQALTGASLQGWFAPDITGRPRVGLGGWSKAEIVDYLATGANGHTIASGPMGEAILGSTSKMTPADLAAIATYLKETGAGDETGATPLAASDPHMRAGAEIYRDTCAACHGADGKGQDRLFPALAGSAAVQQSNPETLARVVIAGTQGVGTARAPTTPAMPSLGWRLDDGHIADVLTYIRNSFGNAAPPVSATTVGDLRKKI